MENNQNMSALPEKEEIQNELKRERNKTRYRRIIKNSIYALLVIAAVAVLVATFIFPVLQISGTSMQPTLNNGEIVVVLKTDDLDRGDLCAFNYSNKVLIKRVIGLPGDEITMDQNGTVYVNGQALDEPYLLSKSYGECDIQFPFVVPQEEYFVMGDQRETSIDSRNTVIGTVAKDQIVGELFLKLWPLSDFSFID